MSLESAGPRCGSGREVGEQEKIPGASEVLGLANRIQVCHLPSGGRVEEEQQLSGVGVGGAKLEISVGSRLGGRRAKNLAPRGGAGPIGVPESHWQRQPSQPWGG